MEDDPSREVRKYRVAIFVDCKKQITPRVERETFYVSSVGEG